MTCLQTACKSHFCSNLKNCLAYLETLALKQVHYNIRQLNVKTKSKVI